MFQNFQQEKEGDTKLKNMNIFLTEVNRQNSYGYFEMNTEEVRDRIAKPLEDVKVNMKEKDWKGKLTMCRFTDYGGKQN